VHELKKLAIVGSGKNTRDLAPFDDQSFDIWVFNEAANSEWCKRWTACFQMHEPEIYKGHNTKDPTHWQWLQKEHGKPIYMQDVDPAVPNSVRFPLEEAQELAGVRMFPTTFAYMAALAIMQGYELIKIYGVELSASEYEYQANGYLFWFGFLRGRLGNNVDSAVLYLDKNIFDVPLYGYEGAFAFGEKYFSDRVNILDSEWASAERSLTNIKKAVERAIEKNDHEKAQSLVLQYQTAALTCGEYAGALAEAERYHTFGNRYADRGGFEFAAATAQRNGEEKKPLSWHYGGMIEYVWNIWKQSNSKQAANQMMGFIEKMGQAAYDTGAALGMYKENLSYLMKYDEMVQANGGKR
jgi:hypothetical protein